MQRLLVVLAQLSVIPALARAQPGQSPRAEIESFNRAWEEATRTMNTAATLALWEDDGVSLLPSTKPIVGKPGIAKFFDEVMAQLHGARMQKFEMQCFDIVASGDWASEWCTEHQIVELGGGKPPFDGWGKMLLVLHKGAGGKWRLTREMWNQAVPADVH